MFITPAHAQTAAGGPMGGLGSFVPLILIFVIFYFYVAFYIPVLGRAGCSGCPHKKKSTPSRP